jgi:hypothetical protein
LLSNFWRGWLLCRWRFRLGCLLLAGGNFTTRRLGHGLQLVAGFWREAFHFRELAGLLGAGAEFID